MRLRLAAPLAVALLVLVGCSSGPPPIEDPREIVSQGVQTLQKATTVHLRVDLAGSVPLDLGGAGSPAEPIPLDGTTIEGDMDIPGQKLDLTFAVPPLLGLTGNVLMIDKAAFLRIPLLGPKWIKQPASGSGASAIGAVSDPQQALADIRQALQDPKLDLQKLADDKCGSKDCYRVRMTLPTDELAGEVSAALGPAVPLGSAAPLPSGSAAATLDVWVEKDTLRIAKVAIEAALGTAATLKATLILSKWGEPVTIEAPPPGEVDETGGGLLPGLMPSFGLPSPQPSP